MKLICKPILFLIIFVNFNLQTQIQFGQTDGQLDPSFGLNGIATQLILDSTVATCIAIQTDGKAVVGGYCVGGPSAISFPTMMRYNTDGTLDTSFFSFDSFSGQPGIIVTNLNTNSQITSIAIQTDGKIVTGGFVYNPNSNSDNFVITRYNTNGGLDTTFNPSGAGLGFPGVVNSNLDNSCQVNSIAIQPDGKILAAGFTSQGQINTGTIGRYNTDGSLDTTFNTTGTNPGFVQTFLGNSALRYNSIALQPDGNIVVVGSIIILEATINYFAVVRYNTNGQLDTTFNPTGAYSFVPGAVVTKFDGSASADSVMIDQNNKILAGGTVLLNNFPSEVAIARYNQDGSLDYNFNPTAPIPPITSSIIPPIAQRGTTSTTIASPIVRPVRLGLQTDGKIIAGTTVTVDNTNKGGLIRYTSTGVIDQTFNPLELGVGFLLTPGITFSQINLNTFTKNFTVLENNQIVTAGSTSVDTNQQAFIVARYFFQNPFINISVYDLSNNRFSVLTGITKGLETINLYIDGKLFNTFEADITGNWSQSIPNTPGNHSGVASTLNASQVFSYSVIGTLAPLIISIPTNGAIQNNFNLISGLTGPNLIVNLSIDGTPVGTTVADPNGLWEFNLTSTYAAGTHTINATTVNSSGQTSSSNKIFTINNNVPELSITSPLNRATIKNLTQVQGTTDASTNVLIYINNIFANFATITQTGPWTVAIPNTIILNKGFNIITALSRDAFGNIARQTSIINYAPDTFVNIQSPLNGSKINTNTPIISGTKESGDSVVVKNGSTIIGTIAANNSTTWSLKSSKLSEGLQTIIATATDSIGTTATAQIKFTVNTKTYVTIKLPANGSKIKTSTPTISGTKQAGDSVVIKNDSVIVGNVAANSSTTWSVKSKPLSDGLHTLIAIARNSSGNTSQAKTQFTVNTNKNAYVTITTPTNGENVIAPFTLRGTATLGSKLTIKIINVISGEKTTHSLQVNQTGYWSYRPINQTLGQNIVRVNAVSNSGIILKASVNFTLVAPKKPFNNSYCVCQ